MGWTLDDSANNYPWRVGRNDGFFNHHKVGRLYSIVMRASHRLGFCWPQDTPVEPGRVWCHWCGMRGRR